MINGICQVLEQAFPEVNVYREQLEQIERPAFFVHTIQTMGEKRMGNLYTRSSSFMIRYHPKEGEPNFYETLDEIAEQLYAVLEWVEQDGKFVRGYEMKHRIEEGVLQFFVTYRRNLKLPVYEPLMEELEMKWKEG